ncbi:MAG TPA: heparinase II/III family protein [Thermomicrobiales bacterium]|nr:heparinase II/III family protein [Thermomicrobiales bacterium]
MTPFNLDIPAFRSARSAQPFRPYDVIYDVDRWLPATAAEAETTMTEGWTFKSLPPVPLATPIAWDEVCRDNRSQHLFLHSWKFLGAVLAVYDRTRDPGCLDFAERIALDWVRQYPSPDTPSPFAWYDLAVGSRAFRLAYIIDAAARDPRFADEAIAQLIASVPIHAEVLANDALFAKHSNHGVYVAASQLAMARRLADLPGMDAARDQALDRLSTMLHAQFTDEGMHREHSPEYHWTIWETFNSLIRTGALGSTEIETLNDRIQESLAWLALPNGSLATFGDTPHHPAVPVDPQAVTNPALKYVVTGGREGNPPPETVRGFPLAGYFVARDRWPAGSTDSDCSYLAQTCAFHSRVHKQADDLAFVWYDRGHELLVDVGRYGYLGKTAPDSELRKQGFWYADPHRIYVESTRAHNTVEIDDRSHERAGVIPYGSALRRWGEAAGICYAESEVTHRGSIRHTRLLLFKPRSWLIVCDWLNDEAGAPHRFTQRFHFAPELELSDRAGSLEIDVPDLADRLYVSSLLPAQPVAPVKGQREPDLLGWISRQDFTVEPCWTAAFSADQTPAHAFATLLAFGKDRPDVHCAEATSRGRSAEMRVVWRQDALTHHLTVERPESEPLSLGYQTDHLHCAGVLT